MAETNVTEICAVYAPLRSGSTLLRLMIDGHPQLCCIGETDYIFDFLKKRDGDYVYDREKLERDRIFRQSGLVLNDTLEGRAAARDLVDQMFRRTGKTPVLMVHHGLDVLSDVFPRAKVVHMLRDPRDVARSSIGMGWAGNVFYGVNHWIRTETGWDEFSHRLSVPPETIRYETLVAEPEAELTRLCVQFGVPYDAAMLSYPEYTTYSAPDATLAYQWKRKLSAREVRYVEARVAHLMSRRGYDLQSSGEKGTLSRLERAYLSVQNWAYVRAYKVKRYGFVNVTIRSVGRRLGFKPLAIWAQKRIDEITLQYLK